MAFTSLQMRYKGYPIGISHKPKRFMKKESVRKIRRQPVTEDLPHRGVKYIGWAI